MKSRPSVLPAGYVGIFLAALLPPIWPRVTGVRVLAHPGGDVSPANIPLRKRAKVLARCPLPGVGGRRSDRRRGGRRPAPGVVEEEVLAARCPSRCNIDEVAAGDELRGGPAALHWPTFSRMFEARAHECIGIGDDGTLTSLGEQLTTEHRAELEVWVGSTPRIGAPPAALKAP